MRMRIILTILTLCLLIIACPGQDKLLHMVVDQYDNPIDAENVTGFVFYKWSGNSAADFDTLNLVLVDTVAQQVTVSEIISTTYFPMDKTIRGGVKAIDGLGRESAMSYSRFYAAPESVDVIRIEDR